MKRILAFIIAMVTLIPFASAQQRSDRSSIRIRLSDGSPLMVTINGRDFQKVGRTLTINDIPRKRQNIQVYKYRPYADGKGGKAELAFSGTIKVQKGSQYDCIVDLGTRKFRMQEVAQLTPIYDRPDFKNAPQSPLNTGNYEEIYTRKEEANALNPALQSLKKSMDAEDADSKKLVLANAYLAAKNINTADAKLIGSWLFFDDNKISFLKNAYTKVSDQQNFSSVLDVLTLEDSKQTLQKFIK
jgi:hypothetical protein